VDQQRVRGLPLVTNGTVNLCASLVGALTACLMHHGDTSPRSCRRGASSRLCLNRWFRLC